MTQKIGSIRYLTHLVTPIDYTIRETNDNDFNKSVRVKCLACAQKSIPENSTLIKDVGHGAYTSGRIIPIENMISFKDIGYREKFLKQIYERFQFFF